MAVLAAGSLTNTVIINIVRIIIRIFVSKSATVD